jgi:hypothetical protein
MQRFNAMDEAQVRAWIQDIGAVFAKGATITGTEVDDKIVAMFFSAVANDFVWGYLWPVIDGLFVDDKKVQASEDLNKACEAAAINPLTIIAIVQALLSLWKQFRKDA